MSVSLGDAASLSRCALLVMAILPADDYYSNGKVNLIENLKITVMNTVEGKIHLLDSILLHKFIYPSATPIRDDGDVFNETGNRYLNVNHHKFFSNLRNAELDPLISFQHSLPRSIWQKGL